MPNVKWTASEGITLGGEKSSALAGKLNHKVVLVQNGSANDSPGIHARLEADFHARIEQIGPIFKKGRGKAADEEVTALFLVAASEAFHEIATSKPITVVVSSSNEEILIRGLLNGSDISERRIVLLQAIASHLETVDLDEMPATIESFDVIAEKMVASLPTVHLLDQDAGPFFDTSGLTKWLGTTRQALRRKVGNHEILAVKTADNRNLYPAFQFDERGEPLPRLREVLPKLDPDDSDSWGSAIWLNATAAELDGRTPAEELRSGDPQKVIDIASTIAAAWAS